MQIQTIEERCDLRSFVFWRTSWDVWPPVSSILKWQPQKHLGNFAKNNVKIALMIRDNDRMKWRITKACNIVMDSDLISVSFDKFILIYQRQIDVEWPHYRLKWNCFEIWLLRIEKQRFKNNSAQSTGDALFFRRCHRKINTREFAPTYKYIQFTLFRFLFCSMNVWTMFKFILIVWLLPLWETFSSNSYWKCINMKLPDDKMSLSKKKSNDSKHANQLQVFTDFWRTFFCS